MKSYQTAQCEFVKEKTAALKVMERKLELESNLQDHKQVMYHIYIHMYVHVEHITTSVSQIDCICPSVHTI